MAQLRDNALILEDVTLRGQFRTAITGALYDPFSVTQVEILDTVPAVIQTVAAADITRQSTGIYEVTVTGSLLATPATYSDRWTYEVTDGSGDVTATGTFVVEDVVPGFGQQGQSVVDQDVLLIHEYRNATTEALITPDALGRVEIIDIDESTILETINTQNLVTGQTGIYQVEANGTFLDTAGTYTARWYHTINPSAEASVDDTFVVTGFTGMGSGAYEVTVNALNSASANEPLEGVEVLASDAVSGAGLLTALTDSAGQAFFNLNAGAYYFSLRDPDDNTQVFSEATISKTVIGLEDVLGLANPNTVTFLGYFFVPNWAAGSPLASSVLCTLSGSVVDMQGRPLSGVDVFIRNRFVPSLSGTKALLGNHIKVTSDNTGLISAVLVQGAEVTVSIAGTGIIRELTIPSTTTADLFTLIGGGQDLFTIIQDNTVSLAASP
jgi:hypothetical protein